jgi:hypothetical protein
MGEGSAVRALPIPYAARLDDFWKEWSIAAL